ncbi:hypothetical protein DTO021D3_4881 [Paecilomyces variotii]|nr:hypothetical protein DTO032I3_1702 [Paecilomyces variotii]KAJ9278147.1 hypothetical protein DTO021D3_4881 [Paecilomyces variotii]KAJ9345511.1 hypothetical protein DTO027B6_2042 [Paecilomyces variotii]KAJ9381605.1 hypothetical protein DTO032I4_6168 [Paecilomyces variotii]
MVVHDACPLRKETGGQTRKTALKVLNHSKYPVRRPPLSKVPISDKNPPRRRKNEGVHERSQCRDTLLVNNRRQFLLRFLFPPPI